MAERTARIAYKEHAAAIPKLMEMIAAYIKETDPAEADWCNVGTMADISTRLMQIAVSLDGNVDEDAAMRGIIARLGDRNPWRSGGLKS